MFEFFRSLVQIVAPLFVVSTMLNVGLTQTLSDIIRHLKNYPFVLKMLVANFVDPDVLVMITLANILGIVMLLFIAKALSSDNKVETETV